MCRSWCLLARRAIDIRAEPARRVADTRVGVAWLTPASRGSDLFPTWQAVSGASPDDSDRSRNLCGRRSEVGHGGVRSDVVEHAHGPRAAARRADEMGGRVWTSPRDNGGSGVHDSSVRATIGKSANADVV